MPIQFHKMHGAGNDFVLLDYRQSNAELDADTAIHLADRRHGVGCDQILVIRASDTRNCLARYEVFNSDGSPAGQCGNGVRCIALYLRRRGEFGRQAGQEWSNTESLLNLEGPSGIVRVRHCPDGEFECAMGEPRFAAADVPIDVAHPQVEAEDNSGVSESASVFSLDLGGERVRIGVVSVGNPHAVTIVEDTESAPVEVLGPRISRHPAFPRGCNAGFAQLLDRENVRLRVFERGTGETQACGSGACATVAVLAREGRVSNAVNVFLPGGHLVIKWSGAGNEMTMKGPAAHVFRGTLDE